MNAVKTQHLSTSLFPDFSAKTLWEIFAVAAGWGLGYFGQPHIITKFMGIRHVSEMYKAKYLGISWQSLALTAATVVGLIGIFFFPNGLTDPQQVILQLVKSTQATFFAGLVLCAILAATTNVMAAQILVVASNLSEDFYKKLIHRDASHQELLRVSRISVLVIGVLAYSIAFFKVSTIYQLVLYSWSGLGASFGPILLFSLYSKHTNKYGAVAGVFVGGITAAVWPYFEPFFSWPMPSMLVGFCFSIIAIVVVSRLKKH
jgi:sodium/proline symporter